MSDKDIVEEARELLAKATPQWERSQLAPAYVISLARGHEVIASFGEYGDGGDLARVFTNAENNMALTTRAPELLRALADEVERLRKMTPQQQCVRCGRLFERLCGSCSNQPSSVF